MLCAPFFHARPVLSRWFVLSVYTLFAGMQGMVWAVPGAVSATYTVGGVYGLSGDTVQLLLNYGPIFYLAFALPVSADLDRFGIRFTVLSGVALVLASCVLRLFANDASPASIALIHASFILNAAAGPAAMAVPSKLANDWFAPHQRTTACAIAALGNQAGALVLYLAVAAAFPKPTRADNFKLNAFLAALALLNAAGAAAYLPSHPAAPPSASAALSRGGEAQVTLASLGRAARALARNAPFLVVTAAYALSSGILNCVNGLLPQNVANLGGDQGTAGWINFAANAAAAAVGVGVAWAADQTKGAWGGAQKAALVATLGVAGAGAAAYAALIAGVGGVGWTASTKLAIVGAAYAVSSAAQGAAIPLMFEAAAEQTGAKGGGGGGADHGADGGADSGLSLEGLRWADEGLPLEGLLGGAPLAEPVPAGTMLMVMTSLSNLTSLITLLMPNSSFFAWANWAGAGVFVGGSLAVAAWLPGSVPRTRFDQEKAADVQ